MKKFCWVQHGDEVLWASQVADTLRRTHGADVVFVCFLRTQLEHYRELGQTAHFIAEILDNPDVSEAELQRLDSEYGPPGIAEIARSDVYMDLLFGDDLAAKYQLIAKAFLWWEAFFDAHQVDYLIFRDTASFATRTAYAIAMARGYPGHGILFVGPVEGTMMMSDVGETMITREFLDTDVRALPPPTAETRRRIDALIAQRLSDFDTPIRIYGAMTPIRFLRYALKNRRRRSTWRRREDPIDLAVARLEFDKTRKSFLSHYMTRRRFPYDQPQADEPYVYFPLIFEGEWQNLVSTPFLAHNLVAVIDAVARALPQGIKLYIKEHPAVPGEFSIARLRRLARIPNVRVIDPPINGQRLARDSQAVICSMGTSGWEAFLLKKPVVVFGETWYTPCPLVYRVGTFDDLAPLIREALTRGSALYEENLQTWYKYIDLVLGVSGEGSISSYKLPFFDHHNLENSEKIAAYIAQRMALRLDAAPQAAVT